jgi:hypothetical protein
MGQGQDRGYSVNKSQTRDDSVSRSPDRDDAIHATRAEGVMANATKHREELSKDRDIGRTTGIREAIGVGDFTRFYMKILIIFFSGDGFGLRF